MNNLSAKYYKKNKERLQKKLVEGIKIFLKRKKKKSSNLAEHEKQRFVDYGKNYSKLQKNTLQ